MNNRFLAFLGFQLRMYLLRARWLLILPVAGFLAYRGFNAVISFDQSAIGGNAPNMWDLIFIALGNYQNIYLAIGLLFVFLISDLIPDPSLGQVMLLRLGSRKQWWRGKVLLLAFSSILLVLTIALFLCLFAMLTLPVQAGYSTLAQSLPDTIGLPIRFFRAITPPPPFVHVLQEILLIILGLFFIGLVVVLVNMRFPRPHAGLAAGVACLIIIYLTCFISGPPWWWKLTPGAHMMYTGVYPLRPVPYPWSLGYWVVAILPALGYGARLSRRMDIVSAREQEPG